MHRIAVAALCAVFSLMVVSYSANSETFVGTAAATGTYKRPLLVVDGKRYELKGSDKADGSVADLLARFSQGDRGTYTITGTRSTVNNNEGILIDSIIPSSIGSVANRVSPNGPNALSRFSNTQLIIVGVVLLSAFVALCILTVGMGYLWQHSRSRNK